MINYIRKNFIRYAVTIFAGGALSAVILVLHGYFLAETLAERYRILCDAFTIPGVLIIMVGLLIVISNTGTLDGLSYAVKGIGRQFIPFLRLQNETFYDYVNRKKEKRKHHECLFLFVTGAIFMTAAIIFLILFNQVFTT